MHMHTHPCTHARTHTNLNQMHTGGVYMCDDSVPASWSRDTGMYECTYLFHKWRFLGHFLNQYNIIHHPTYIFVCTCLCAHAYDILMTLFSHPSTHKWHQQRQKDNCVYTLSWMLCDCMSLMISTTTKSTSTVRFSLQQQSENATTVAHEWTTAVSTLYVYSIVCRYGAKYMCTCTQVLLSTHLTVLVFT